MLIVLQRLHQILVLTDRLATFEQQTSVLIVLQDCSAVQIMEIRDNLRDPRTNPRLDLSELTPSFHLNSKCWFASLH